MWGIYSKVEGGNKNIIANLNAKLTIYGLGHLKSFKEMAKKHGVEISIPQTD